MTEIDASSERRRGIILLAASALLFALTGTLTKSISADPLSIACWRGLVGGGVMTLYVLWLRARGNKRETFRLGRSGWTVALVGGLASIAFIASFKFSYVANVTIIYATVPFAAAIIGYVVLQERFGRRTAIAAAAALAGVAVMMGGGLHGDSLFGDALALVMTLLSALYIVLVRRFRDTPVVWAGAVSGFLLFGLGWAITDPWPIAPGDLLLLFTFGCSSAVAIILWTEGARFVPAAEGALVGIAEVPAGILLAWLLIGEQPPAASLIGGAIVLAAVCWHAVADWRAPASVAKG